MNDVIVAPQSGHFFALSDIDYTAWHTGCPNGSCNQFLDKYHYANHHGFLLGKSERNCHTFFLSA